MAPSLGQRRYAPNVVAPMLALSQCAEASAGLEEWLRQALNPYFSVESAPLAAAPLEEMLRDVPVLLDPREAACVWSGHVGDVACWELRDADGRCIARLATAPKPDLHMPQELVRRHPYAYHQSGIGAGPGFHDQHGHTYDDRVLRDGPHFNGYILGDDLVGALNVGRGARLFYIVGEFPGAGVVDYDGYWDGEALLARLAFVDES